MKLKIVSVGRERADPFASAVADYATRCRKFLPVDEVILKKDREDRIATRMLKEAEKGDLLVALDERGEEYDSRQFAKIVSGWMNRGFRQVTLSIGGADGLPDDVVNAAGLTMALSKMTLPHRMARLMLMEQLYRALCIIRNVPYQK